MSPSSMRIRRFIGLSAASALAFALFAPHEAANAASTNVTVDNLVYSIDEDNPGSPATVVNYVRGQLNRDLTIPEYITYNNNQYPVTTIGESAFQGAYLSTVVLPASVTKIDTLAFKSNRLKEVVLPQGVTHIGESAFESNSLTTVTLPDSVKTMGSAAFKNNLSLASVTLGKGLTGIPASTFINTKITQVEIPANITSIGAAAFASSGLESLNIPSTVTTIGPSAFEANRIAALTLPEGMTTIPASAFKNNRLSSLTLPSTITEIGASAFASNRITSVVIPQGVTVLPTQVFHSNSLTSVTFHDELRSIGEEAFEYNNLTEITIPASVTEVGRGAFGSNYDLKKVHLKGQAPTIVEPSQWGGHKGSFGTYNRGLVIEYPQKYGAEYVGESGYTTPTWKRYTTVPVAPTHAKLQMTSVIDGGQAQTSDVAFVITHRDSNEEVADQADLLPGTYRLTAQLAHTSVDGTYESQGWDCRATQTPEETKEISSEGELTVAAGEDITCTHRFAYIPAPPTPLLSVTVDQEQIAAGKTITFTASGFNADEDVTFTVHSDPVRAGAAAANADGVAVLRWAVPTDFPVGMHHVRATGRDGSVQAEFTVIAANNDNPDSDGKSGTGGSAGAADIAENKSVSSSGQKLQLKNAEQSSISLAATGLPDMSVLIAANIALASAGLFAITRQKKER